MHFICSFENDVMRCFLLFFVLAGTFCQLTVAQSSGTISGRILDFEDNGEPLLFANISLKNTAISEQTNFHGNFEIEGVLPGDYVIAISYLGYETKELPIQVKANQITSIHEALKALSLNSPALTVSEPGITAEKTPLVEAKGTSSF